MRAAERIDRAPPPHLSLLSASLTAIEPVLVRRPVMAEDYPFRVLILSVPTQLPLFHINYNYKFCLVHYVGRDARCVQIHARLCG